MMEHITLLIFQLAAIIFAAYLAGELFRKMRLPSVLGEILAGTLIGPYALGTLSFPGFPDGLFPHAGAFPVSIELYSLAVIASIILLFLVGLETDTQMFLRFSFTGSVLGIGGVVVSFAAGDFLGVLFCRWMGNPASGPLDAIPLFLGVISTATSVGISARILSEHGRSNSPDGVAIISAAVIDDVLGVIALAIVVGMAKTSHLSAGAILLITLKAVVIWLGFTAVGLLGAHRLGRWLKTLRNHSLIAVLSFAMALLLSGIFEMAGLAMIIGAYVMGISLSKTDLVNIIQRRIHVLHDFFVPVFFCVMGMLVDLRELFSWPIVSFGSLYVLLAVSSKILGCGLPALFLNFNLRGAVRIGVGMVPRGEVALIVAGIGLSSGIIGDQVFSLAVFMTFVTTLLAPPLLNHLLQGKGEVLKNPAPSARDEKWVRLAMPNPETAELVLERVLKAFHNEGYYVHRMSATDPVYHLRRGESFLVLDFNYERIKIECTASELSFINLLAYEVLAELERLMSHLQSLTNKDQIGRGVLNGTDTRDKNSSSLSDIIAPAAVHCALKGDGKKAVFEEILEILHSRGIIHIPRESIDAIIKDLLDREALMSTGMENGIALPHVRTDSVVHTVAFLGILRRPLNWKTLDNKPVHIILFLLVPKGPREPYLHILSRFSRVLAKPEKRLRLSNAKSDGELYQVLIEPDPALS